MFGFYKKSPAARKNYSDCSGCSLCLLVCPVWRKSRDVSLTPHGHAKALQNGISIAEVAASVKNCTLCMACEPVCPENIDIIGMILGLRRQQVLWERPPGRDRACRGQEAAPTDTSSTMLLPDQALHAHPNILARVAALLEISISEDDGADISLALESGATIAERRLQRFLDPLRKPKKIIVADGLLLRYLKQWLPDANTIGLGEALSGHVAVRRGLRATDLYMIEPRAYHTDYQRTVKHYDRLRADHGCAFNLDLQRIVIPATARNLPQRLGLAASNDEGQAHWALHGRNISRIVVESLEDLAAFENVSDVPVMHLAEVVQG
ncbi:MAG: 4Fe-4S dicluster domain-containing protein [Nitrosomonadales bacterium]|nr:4Fe-4S dicluster domain-containing protein [Nitrosomonadales bacterium]